MHPLVFILQSMKGTTYQEFKTMEKVHGSSLQHMKKTGKDVDKLKEIARQQGVFKSSSQVSAFMFVF